MSSKAQSTKQKGDNGEQIVVDYLLAKGYAILVRNYRIGKSEIDLITQKNQEIVFVEVKTRDSFNLNTADELLSIAQQKRIINAAHDYIVINDIDLEARFDLVIVIISSQAAPKIEHIENAFYPTL